MKSVNEGNKALLASLYSLFKGLYFVCFHFPNLVKGEVLLYCNVKGSGVSVPIESILLLLHCLFEYLLFILNKHWFTPFFCSSCFCLSRAVDSQHL